MLRRVRPPLLLVLLLLALLTGSYFLWHGLHTPGSREDSGSPASGSSRKAVEFLSNETPPAEQGPTEGQETPPPGREKLTRDLPRRGPATDPDATASITGLILDLEGRPVPGTEVFLARWIEDESALAPPAVQPRVPARIAVHLPIDVADPEGAGLPVPVCVQPDESGNFRVPLAPGRWRMLVRSTLAPYERNDLLLAANEQRDLGRILLRPGIIYRFQFKDAHGAKATDVRAAPLLAGMGAEFPPLAGALALPFLMPPPKDDGPQLSLPQRPVPITVWLRGPHTRALRLPLDPANPALAVVLPDADHLRGAVQYSGPPADGLFTIHARPLDFFESPIGAEFRADVAHAGELHHAFDLELPERATLYEIQAAFADEPPLLASPWSPPRYTSSNSGADPRPQVDPLREPLVWRPDAQIRFELLLSDTPLPSTPAELLLPGVFVRRWTQGAPIQLSGAYAILGGLRLLRSPAPQLLVQRPGCALLSQALTLLPGADSDLGRLALTALPAFRIQVVDASSSKPIPGATIRPFEELGDAEAPEPLSLPGAVSDGQGEARAFAPSLDLSTFEVRAPNHAPAYVPAAQRAPDGSLRVRLYRGATVRVRVFDADAAPLRAAQIDCTRGEWTPDLGPPHLLDTQSTDVQGYATFVHVTPGKHSFRIRSVRKLQPSEWSIVELGDGETRELSLATRARARLHVRVTDAAGPRPNALVTLEPTELDLSAHPLCADDPLPYGIDAYTDSRGEAVFDDLATAHARLTLTLPDSPLRLRRSLRLRPGAQTCTFDLSDTSPLAIAELPPAATALDLRILPQPITLQLDDDPILLSDLDLEHTSRLDRRHGRPDLSLALPAALAVPSDLLASRLFLATPTPALALALALNIDPQSDSPAGTSPPALTPTQPLELTLLSLHLGERYVLVLGRTFASQIRAYLDAHPEIREQVSAADLENLSSSDELSRSLLLERTLPFVASAPSLTFTLAHLLPGETFFRLYRVGSNGRMLLADSLPQTLKLSADAPARLQLTTRD